MDLKPNEKDEIEFFKYGLLAGITMGILGFLIDNLIYRIFFSSLEEIVTFFLAWLTIDVVTLILYPLILYWTLKRVYLKVNKMNPYSVGIYALIGFTVVQNVIASLITGSFVYTEFSVLAAVISFLVPFIFGKTNMKSKELAKEVE